MSRLDPDLVAKWTPERVQRQCRRNELTIPAAGSLWHDAEGYPFRWDGHEFRPDGHRYAPEEPLFRDWEDQLSYGGLVRKVTNYYGPRTYQELEEDGLWHCYSDGLYGRSKQVGEGNTRFDALSSALRSLGDWVMNGVSEVILPRRKKLTGGEDSES